MKKIKLFLAAVAAMVGMGASAQTDEQYNAALAAYPNGQYVITTEFASTTYYLKSNGYLTADPLSASIFYITQTEANAFVTTSFKIGLESGKGIFTNGGDSNNNFSGAALNHILTGTQNRAAWEGQVFYLDDNGNCAVRSTAANSASWGASAFWTVVDDNDSDGLPNATYTVSDVPYVWKIADKTLVEIAQAKAEYSAAKAIIVARAEAASVDVSAAVSAADAAVDAATTLAEVKAEAEAALLSIVEAYRAGLVVPETGMDVTSWITNAAPYENANGWTAVNGNRLNQWASNPVTFDSGNQCAEFWNNTGAKLSQNLILLPAGSYKLTAIALQRENAGSTLFAGSNSIEIVNLSDGVNSRSDANTWFNNGNGINELDFNLGSNTSALEIGLRTGTNGDAWTVWRSFTLTYYGLDLSKFAEALADAVAAAENASVALKGTIPAAAYFALNAVVEENNKTYSTAEGYEAATEAINNAVTSAQALVAPYAAYKIAAEDAAIACVASETVNAQNAAVEEATTAEAIEACTAALRSAINGTQSFDITTFTITNASPYANGDNWIATNGTRLNDWASNPVTYDSGNKCAEMWNNTGASMLYTITNLPAGHYRLTAIAGAREGSGGVLKVGDKTVELVSVGSVNSRAQAGEWFNNGGGVNELFFELDDTATELTIGLVAGTSGDAWTLWRSFKLETFDESIAAGYLAPGFATLVEEATATFNDATYANVTGDEKTALEAALAATPSTIAEYEAAVNAINNAVAAFTAAAPAYDFYAKERAIADAISTEIAVAAPTTADECIPAVKALKVAEYNYVLTAYPYSATSKIGEFSTWERTGTVNGSTKNDFEALTSQHWSGTAMTYYEQPAGGWGSNAWTANYTKTTTLPAGNYVIKVAARAASSGGTTADIFCSATSLTSPIPAWGDTGKGITTAGAASFDEGEFCNGGNGRGWVWNYLPFTLTEETEVTMTVVAEGKGQYQWFSVCDGELLSMTNIATAVAYDEAIANTIEDVDVANVTMTRNIKVGFNTVVLPFSLTSSQVQTAFGTGTEVYTFSEESSDPHNVTINFTKVVAGTISANVPVLVKATQASTEQVFQGVQVVAPTTDVQVAGNIVTFKGIYAPITVAEGDYFIGNDALCKSEGKTNLKAFRAYIDAQEGAEIKMFVGGEEIATGISSIKNGQLTIDNAPIYNLAGQRIQKMQKGINIVNGRKVMK